MASLVPDSQKVGCSIMVCAFEYIYVCYLFCEAMQLKAYNSNTNIVGTK